MKVNIPIRDIVYGFILASFAVVGAHSWYHQKQQIAVLQNNVEYLHKFLETMRFAGPQ